MNFLEDSFLPIQQNYNDTDVLPSLLWNTRKKMADPQAFDRVLWKSFYQVKLCTTEAQLVDILIQEMESQFSAKEVELLRAEREKYQSSFNNLEQRFFSGCHGESVFTTGESLLWEKAAVERCLRFTISD